MKVEHQEGTGSRTMEFSVKRGQVCPHVRMTFDAGTAFNFPSEHNYCRAQQQPKSILMEHQELYCLCEHFTECPAFRRKGMAQKLDFIITNLNGINPPEAHVLDVVAAKTSTPYFYAMVFMLFLVMVGILVQFALL